MGGGGIGDLEVHYKQESLLLTFCSSLIYYFWPRYLYQFLVNKAISRRNMDVPKEIFQQETLNFIQEN